MLDADRNVICDSLDGPSWRLSKNLYQEARGAFGYSVPPCSDPNRNAVSACNNETRGPLGASRGKGLPRATPFLVWTAPGDFEWYITENFKFKKITKHIRMLWKDATDPTDLEFLLEHKQGKEMCMV